MPIPPRRRSFQFSLRTMFILLTATAVICWLTLEIMFVRERQAWLRNERQSHSLIKSASEWLGPVPETARVPSWRRMLGDEAIVKIGLATGSNQADLDRAKKLFPEADVMILSQGNGRGGFM
jgi:hypothetical protein